MFGKKKWAAVILAVALAAGFTYPVRAEGEAETQVDNVALKIKSDIRPGSGQGKVKVATSNVRYHVEDSYITNEPEGQWEESSRPRVRITLEAEEGYGFKPGFSKSDVSLSGTEATVFSVSRNSETKLVIIVTIVSVSKDKEGYDLEVYDLQWDKERGCGLWGPGSDAKKYEVKLYRGDSLLNDSTWNTSAASFNFSHYITEEGPYTFQVRGVYNSSYKGEWAVSQVWEVDGEMLEAVKALAVRAGDDQGGDAVSNPSDLSPQGPAGSLGAWLHDGAGWWYCNADKSYTTNDWQKINGKYYFFDEHGYMTVGWIFWNNVYYYCGLDGSLLTDAWTPEGYYVDGNGAWVEGLER